MFKPIVLFFFMLLFTNTSATSNYGNRHYISNKLLKIFGESSSDILNSEIMSQIQIFGGPCSLMEDVNQDRQMGVNCPNGFSDSKVPMNSEEKMQRSKVVSNVCKQLVKRDKTFKYAIRNISTKEDHYYTDLIKLFYPFSDEVKEKVNKLKKLNIKAKTLDDKMRKILELICLSERWQKL